MDHNIFVTNVRVCNFIILIFINNLHNFVLYQTKVISEIKTKFVIVFAIVDIEFFAFYIRLKITRN